MREFGGDKRGGEKRRMKIQGVTDENREVNVRK
jgi:hypothetical protein